jgi:hypothetical protein
MPLLGFVPPTAHGLGPSPGPLFYLLFYAVCLLIAGILISALSAVSRLTD